MAQRPPTQPSADMDRIRAALKNFRQNRHVSVAAWEEAAGLGQGTLSKFLRGTNRDIGIEALTRLAAAQNATVGQIIGESDAPAAPSLAIDRDLLAQVIETVERHASASKATIEAADKALAMLVIYDAAKGRDPSGPTLDELVANVLRLALRTGKTR